ncbi:MAG: hypothetical protein ACFCU8_18605 [Thermosynechococcaceae cyanobacterium]
MTQVASSAAVEGYAEVQRIINICCAWSGYVMKTQSERPPAECLSLFANLLGSGHPLRDYWDAVLLSGSGYV